MQKIERAGEPTMEEILASIRQIIAEEPPGSRPSLPVPPQSAALPAAPAPQPAPLPAQAQPQRPKAEAERPQSLFAADGPLGAPPASGTPSFSPAPQAPSHPPGSLGAALGATPENQPASNSGFGHFVPRRDDGAARPVAEAVPKVQSVPSAGSAAAAAMASAASNPAGPLGRLLGEIGLPVKPAASMPSPAAPPAAAPAQAPHPRPAIAAVPDPATESASAAKPAVFPPSFDGGKASALPSLSAVPTAPMKGPTPSAASAAQASPAPNGPAPTPGVNGGGAKAVPVSSIGPVGAPPATVLPSAPVPPSSQPLAAEVAPHAAAPAANGSAVVPINGVDPRKVAVQPPQRPQTPPATAVVPQPVSMDLQPVPSGTGQVRTLEDTVVDLLRPMLRSWLDENMPRIVEKALRVELAEQLKRTAPPKSE